MSTLVREYTALGFDPAPGVLGRIGSTADQYRRVHDQLGFARESIDSIINQTGTWEGEASQAFARRVGDLPEYLGLATESMAVAADAVTGWQSSLGGLQDRAWELEMRARQARAEAESARNNPDFGLANQTFHDEQSLNAAQRVLDAAARRLDTAIAGLEAVLEDAVRLQGEHASTAQHYADLLRRARDIAPDEPGLLGRALEALGDWASEALNDAIDVVRDVAQAVGDFIADNANLIAAVSDILGDLSTIIGVVADFLPPPADTIVGAVSLGLGVYALGGHLLAKAAGADVSWNTIILDSVGIATGLVGLIPAVPGGVANAAFQAGWEVGAASQGEEGGTTVGKFIPRNDRQWATAAAGVLFPPLLLAPGAENVVTSWVDGVGGAVEKDNAGQAERDRQRAEERVWE